VTGAYNINRLFGIEGEFGGGVGVKQKLDFELGAFENQKSPHNARLQRQLGGASNGERSRLGRELEIHQAGALRDLREFAYSRSRFYQRFHKGLTTRPLHELPVLTKATLMEKFDDLVTQGE